MRRIPFRSGDENDIMSRRARRVHGDVLKRRYSNATKTRYRRRERRVAKLEICSEVGNV